MNVHPKTKTLIRFVDEDLAQAQAEKVRTHLGQCERCQKRVDMLQQVQAANRPKEELPQDFKGRIVAQLGEVKPIRQPVCGEVRSTVGTLLVSRNGEEAEVQGFPGMALRLGDRLRVLGESLALVELNDASTLYLNRDTELKFSTGTHPLSLFAGELLAMMKPQRKPFEVWTPAAVLGVIGTDFDTTVQDKTTTLKVLKGRVSFQNDAGKTVVKKRQQVEATKHVRPTTTRLSETRSITNWTKPVRPEKVRGGTGLRTLGYLVVLLGLILAGIWYFGQQREPAAPEILKLEKTEPLTLRSPYQEEGLSWRLRINDQTKRDNTWVDTHKVIIRCEVIEVDEEKGSRVRVTLEDATDAEGLPETETAEKMIGRQFEYQVSPEGKFHSSRTADGKALEWDEISGYAMAMWGTDFSAVYLKNPMVPGDQWTDQLEDRIPGYPNSYARGVGSYEFVGYELRDGVEYGVVRVQIAVSLGGGIPIEKTVEPRIARYARLDNMNMNIQGEYLLDVENGRVVSTKNFITRGKIKGTVTSIIQGRSQPVTETIERETGVVTRSFTTVEYLP